MTNNFSITDIQKQMNETVLYETAPVMSGYFSAMIPIAYPGFRIFTIIATVFVI